jgi:hypothetical protein
MKRYILNAWIESESILHVQVNIPIDPQDNPGDR